MRSTLALLLDKASASQAMDDVESKMDVFFDFIHELPAQIVILSSQVMWSKTIENSITSLSSAADRIELLLNSLADKVVQKVSPDRRKKYEQLMTEFVHQRDVTRQLIELKVDTAEDFYWLSQLRYYYFPNEEQDSTEA